MFLTLAPVAALLSGCGGDDDDAADEAAADGCVIVDGADGEPTTTVDVALSEYAIEAPGSVDAGTVAFRTANDGAVDHELVVLAASPDEIEAGEDGAPVEVGFVGEVEAFPAGETCTGAFELAAGEYTLLCAIVEESGESHFGEGMVTSITVS